MRVLSWLLLAASCALVVALVVWTGLDDLAEMVSRGGWGLLLVVAFWLPQNALASFAWLCLFPPRGPREGPTFSAAFVATWMGTSVNTLLPVASIGGTFVKARVIHQRGVNGAQAVASAVVDKTVQTAVLAAWSLAGLGLLAAFTANFEAALAGVAGIALLGLGVAVFARLQVAGSLGRLARVGERYLRSKRWPDIVASAAALDRALAGAYARRRGVALSAAGWLAGRIVLLGEVMLASHLMGQPIGVYEALLIRGVVAGLEAALFVVPDGLGIAEAGYVGVGALLGYPADLMLVIALLIRARATLPSVPGLLLYQRFELRALELRRAARAVERDPA